ncbi:MAG: DUF1800 domain-containing protein [Planctomycetota bacterium]|nr:MAG: DUF1800 domain-containing protein [Planctomycetota bacterium]
MPIEQNRVGPPAGAADAIEALDGRSAYNRFGCSARIARPSRWRPVMFRLPQVLLVSLIAVGFAHAGPLGKNSLAPIKQDDWTRDAAAHLLRRAGFGGTPAEIERLYALGPRGAVDYLVDYQKIPYDLAPPKVDPAIYEPPDRRELRTLTEEERRKFFDERRKLDRAAFEEIRLWWIERMVESPRPLEEKMTLFWHGHFTSGMREVRNALFMFEQNQFLRRNALGNFRELLLGIGRDRAMLVYLDGNKNEKEHPNENYARELMELFTLGVGNYTEKDVTEAARAFTGWDYDRSGFRFRPGKHDFGKKQFLRKSGRFDGDDIVDIILEQRAASRFLAKNLLEFFCRPEPDKALVEALAREIRREKYELRPIMKKLLLSQAFYHPISRGCLVKSPVEIVIGTARTLGVEIRDLPAANRAMIAMGQELMQPPNVKGWDGGAAWINTATLFNRYNVVSAMIHGFGDRDARRSDEQLNDEQASANRPMMMKMEPRSRRDRAPQPAYDVAGIVASQNLRTPEQIVDYFARHLLAVPLPDAKREKLVAYLSDTSGRKLGDDRRAELRLRQMVALMCSTPEYQLH